jgi:hypothetical protein
MGLDEAGCLDVLREFSDDLLFSGRCDAWQCQIDSDQLHALLNDLDDPEKQKETLRMMFDVIRADGRLARGESQIFWEALQQWRLKLSDITATASAAAPKRRTFRATGKIAGAASPASIRTSRPRRASHPWQRR